MDLPPGTGDIAISVAQLVPSRRTARRHDAAAGRPRGRRAGRLDRAADPPADRRRRREHELARPARRLAHGAVRRRRRAGRGRLAGRARPARRCRCSGRSRSTSAVREGGDDGVPVVLSDPDSPAARAYDRGRRRAGRRASTASSGARSGSRPCAAEPAGRRARSGRVGVVRRRLVASQRGLQGAGWAVGAGGVVGSPAAPATPVPSSPNNASWNAVRGLNRLRSRSSPSTARWIAAVGLRLRRSMSANSGPSSSRSWVRAPVASSRSVRIIRAASRVSAGQPVRAEHDEADERQHDELHRPDVEHPASLRPPAEIGAFRTRPPDGTARPPSDELRACRA